MKLKPWTIALLLLIIADSVYTIFIGYEGNPLILWAMTTFDMSLNVAMIIRVIYCLPLLYILNLTNWSKFTFFIYIGIYITLSGAFLL